jgi:multisubunit Na+/H+ antiporter MnhF subunit
MTIWELASLVLLLGAVAPAALLGSWGTPVQRLVALLQLGAASVLFLVVFAQADNRADYLIVPLALVLVSFAGALVFARLLVPRR